jgi:DNA polymerase III epsilon subunit-like protein
MGSRRGPRRPRENQHGRWRRRAYCQEAPGRRCRASGRADYRETDAAEAALGWARAMRQPGAAVILDTETTDFHGYVLEVAVIDAATGATLLDTLVNPACPLADDARRVHGITDEQLDGAPQLAQVWPQLLEVTAGRTVIAYNADFDRDTIVRHARRDGLRLRHLGRKRRWSCLMNRRSDWLMTHNWLPLSGAGHRAQADCVAALQVLTAMAARAAPAGASPVPIGTDAARQQAT